MYILGKRRGLPLKKVVIAVRSARIYVAFIAGSNLDWWFMFIIKKVWYCISFSLLSPSQVKLICMIFIFLLIRWKQVEMKRTFLFGSCLMVPTLMIPPHVQLVKKLNLTYVSQNFSNWFFWRFLGMSLVYGCCWTFPMQ